MTDTGQRAEPTSWLPRVTVRTVVPSRRKVRSLLHGEYASLHTGRSLDFHDVREYVRGDDVRDLDWKASARSGHLLVKRYVAPRKHVVLLAVPAGRSMRGACADGTPKSDLAVHVAGLVGWLAARHGDLVGIAQGEPGSHEVQRPAQGERRLDHALGRLHHSVSSGVATTDAAALLDHVHRSVRRRAIVLLVCDAVEVDDALAAAVRRTIAQHEVLVVTVGDVDPTAARPHGAPLADADSDRALPRWLQHDAALADDYAAEVERERAEVHSRLTRLGVTHEHVATGDAVPGTVLRLLRRHRHGRA